MNHRRATIVDVAREAGVSTATVSRSLREDPRVRPDTRERVREAAEKLRFVPNAQAAGLASGESRTVGLLAPLLTTWYTSEVVAGVEEALSLARYDLLLGTADPLATERVYRGAEGIRQRTDGMILVDALCQEDGARRLLEQGIAAVALGEELASISSITIDNVAGGKLAAEHLVARGKSQLAVIAGVVESPETSVLGGRLAGFGSGVRDAAMSEPLLEMDALSIEGGGRAMARLLASHRPIDAVFALSDEMAFGAIAALRESGLEPGRDVAVVGFDDHPAAAPFGLTTVRQPVREMGALAANELIDQISSRHTPRHVEVPLTLIERSSTAI
ncbi:MAG: LacI family DNA-binding transcriptional regulator [Nocardioides sp.]